MQAHARYLDAASPQFARAGTSTHSASMTTHTPSNLTKAPISGDSAPRRARAAATIAAELVFEDVHHAYGERVSLRGIDLRVKPGEVVCLLGPSGCGKSTLLRLAAGLESVRQGEIRLDNLVVSRPDMTIPPERRGVGMMFQDFALFPHLSILANVAFGLRGLPGQDAEREALAALARVGLDAYAAAYPHALSGGEQQRVALARAIVPRPGVLLMDEPFSGLDKRLRDAVRDDTMSVLREARATSVMVTHDPEEAMRMADRIVLMRAGRIVQAGTADELYRAPADIESARFFAELNEIDGTVHGGFAVTPLGGFPVQGMADGAHVHVCIRQQGIRLAPVAVPAGDVPEGRDGRVVGRRFLGEVDVVELAVDGLDRHVTARVHGVCAAVVGTDVRVWIDPDDVMVFPRVAA